MKSATWMWEPKPMTLSWMVCLKPKTTLTEIIMTARPMATPAMAIRTAGLETFCLSPV